MQSLPRKIVSVLLGEGSKDDLYALIRGEDPEAKEWEEKALLYQMAKVAAKEPLSNPNEGAIPARYYRSKSRLMGLAKHVSRAAHVARVQIVDGNHPPTIVCGSTGGWFTKGGTPISHPSAYSKTGWSNMDYICNDEEVQVGADWLFVKLPHDLATYFRYVSLDPSRAGDVSTAEHWIEKKRQQFDRAYSTAPNE